MKQSVAFPESQTVVYAEPVNADHEFAKMGVSGIAELDARIDALKTKMGYTDMWLAHRNGVVRRDGEEAIVFGGRVESPEVNFNRWVGYLLALGITDTKFIIHISDSLERSLAGNYRKLNDRDAAAVYGALDKLKMLAHHNVTVVTVGLPYQLIEAHWKEYFQSTLTHWEEQ